MTRRGSVHEALVAIRCLSLVMERHSATQAELDRDGRVTTQATTQASCLPSGQACVSDCPYSALIIEQERATARPADVPWNRLQQSGEGRNLRARVRRAAAFVRVSVPARVFAGRAGRPSPLTLGFSFPLSLPFPLASLTQWRCRRARIIVREWPGARLRRGSA